MLLRSFTFWVFAGAFAGVVLALLFGDSGWAAATDAPAWYQLILITKRSFLSLLRMLIAPLIFFSLIGGLVGIGSVVRLKRLGGITIAYYLLTTGIAIVLGLIAVFYIHPWTSYPAGMQEGLAAVEQQSTIRMIDTGSDSIVSVLGTLLAQAFQNPFSALAQLNIVGIVTNAILIGLAIVLILPEDSPVITFVEHVNRVIARILGWVILVLPIGIFAILFDFTLRLNGHGAAAGHLLAQLFSFALLVVGMTLAHGLVILPLLAWVFGGRKPLDLLNGIVDPLLVAFSTSSSSATLPVSMKASEEELGLEPGVTSFVLPLGATMNMDGTALFEAIAAIFLAYIYGVDLSATAMVTIFFMTMIASIGAPGMPSASMAGMQIILLAVGIPLEAIGLLMVIERPLDAIRTAVNVEGDLVGATIVNRLISGPTLETE